MATYLITGATGQQGGATIRFLLEADAKVRAVVRNSLTPSAQELAKRGVEIFQGTHEDFDVFSEAARGCRGIFLNLTPSADRNSMPRQTRGIIQACLDAKVEAIVVSTAFFTGNREKWDGSQNGYDDPSLRAYFEAKLEVEDIVRKSGLQYTILRPAWIHSNYLLPNSRSYCPGLADNNELVHSYDDGVKMPHIDELDIGKFAAAALQDQGRFGGQEIELGNENLTAEQVRSAIKRVVGRDLKLRKRTPDEVETARDAVVIQMFQLWANHVNLIIDGEALQAKFGIPMVTFEEYLRREEMRMLASLPEMGTG
ncbi:hypothetical protein ABKA04_006938 [Annulohypoxylon sp. FPYF3050]